MIARRIHTAEWDGSRFICARCMVEIPAGWAFLVRDGECTARVDAKALHDRLGVGNVIERREAA